MLNDILKYLESLKLPSLDLSKIDSGLLRGILEYDQRNPLLFNTGLFLVLFVAFILIYQAVRRWKNVKLIFVILFSLYFYYKSSAVYCFILLGVCLSDYFLGLLLDHAKRKWVRKLIVLLNIVINVGMLIYFKYFNLLYETFANISGTRFDPLDIVLPAGISFFTFRSISYLVDIYRGEIRAATNFIEYVFFLTFFPPLLAGPVVRAKDMLPQIRANEPATRIMVSEGFFLIMAGLIKKVIVADYISSNFVDRIFENPSLYTGFENLLGSLGYVLQIYCDFSGYSDMAIGLALLMGYRFKDNFLAPYKSQSPTEFWKRWHISLSTWLMDYLYIPLGGNRKGRFRQYVNLMTTMLIGGIWHGASWMYLLWGGYNGALLIGHKAIKRRYRISERLRGKRIIRALNVMLTFVLISIGFVILRASSIESLGEIFTAIGTNFHPEIAWQFVEGYTLVAILLVGGYLMHFLPERFYGGMQRAYNWLPLTFQAIILAVVIFLVIQTRQSEIVPFIYLQY